jgi:hypothetical protein
MNKKDIKSCLNKLKEPSKEILIDSIKSLFKIILTALFLWLIISLITFKYFSLKDLIQDILDNQIKTDSRIHKFLKENDSFKDSKTNTINYSKYYTSEVMEDIELPTFLKVGNMYLKDIKKYNLNGNNTKSLEVFTQELNSFHSKILLNLFKDEREAFNALFKIFDENKCTFEFIDDANYKSEIYDKVLLDIQKVINLTLIYFDKFDKNDKKFNNNLSSFYLVSFSPYYTGGMCNIEDLEKISK